MPSLALYQPEIPHNTGALIRLSACFGSSIHLIAPFGFNLLDKSLRRAGLDYFDRSHMILYDSWDLFKSKNVSYNFILATPHTENSYLDWCFQKNDIIILGQESCGFPDFVLKEVDNHITIPIKKDCRSLNLAISGGILLAESCRQLKL